MASRTVHSLTFFTFTLSSSRDAIQRGGILYGRGRYTKSRNVDRVISSADRLHHTKGLLVRERIERGRREIARSGFPLAMDGERGGWGLGGTDDGTYSSADIDAHTAMWDDGKTDDGDGSVEDDEDGDSDEDRDGDEDGDDDDGSSNDDEDGDSDEDRDGDKDGDSDVGGDDALEFCADAEYQAAGEV